MSAGRSPITTHVLDLRLGRPASGMRVTLEFPTESTWQLLADRVTDVDGRVADLLPAGSTPETGPYRLRFETGDYFLGQGLAAFYPEVVVMFEVDDPSRHYHIPLLLSPFGYSTYRGS